MRCLTSFLVVCLMATVVQAAAVAKITGPTSAYPGDLVVLTSDGTVGTAYQWAIIPTDAGSRCFQYNERDNTGKLSRSIAVFATRTEGVYTFVLASAESDTVALALHTVTISSSGPPPGPGPGPGPNPPPPPPGDIATTAYNAALKVNAPAEALVMARVYRKVANNSAADKVAKMILSTNTERVLALGFDRSAAWDEWARTVAAAIASRTATIDEWRQVWLQIAIGLEKAGGGVSRGATTISVPAAPVSRPSYSVPSYSVPSYQPSYGQPWSPSDMGGWGGWDGMPGMGGGGCAGGQCGPGGCR